MQTRTKPFISDLALVIWIFVFFPITFILLFLRFLVHHNYSHLRSKDYNFLAVFFFVLFSLISFTFIVNLIVSDSSYYGQYTKTYLIFSVTLLGPSILFKIRASYINKEIENRQNRYSSLIYEQRITSISQIAEIVKKRRPLVVQELLWMSHIRRLSNVTVDPSSDQVLLHTPTSNDAGNAEQAPNPIPYQENNDRSASTPILPKIITCYGCGAKTQLQPRESKPCEYCRAMLHYS